MQISLLDVVEVTHLKEEAHATINEREGRIGYNEQLFSSLFQRIQHLYHF